MQSISQILERAQLASLSGEVRQAATLWDEAVQRAREEPRAFLAIIRDHMANKRYGQVTRAYRVLATAAPELLIYAPFEPPASASEQAGSVKIDLSVDQHLERGQLMQLVGDLDAAERHFRAAEAASDETDTRAKLALHHFLRPWRHGATVSADRARSLFVRAYGRDLESEDHRRLGGLNGHLALGRLAGTHSVVKALASDLIFYEAALLQRMHLLSVIATHYAAAVGLYVDEVEWLVEMKKAVQGRDFLADAANLYRAITLVRPEHALAWYALGTLEILRNDLEAAESHLKHSFSIDPGLEPFALLRLAAVAELRLQFERAADLFQAASAALVELGAYHINAARCLRRVGRHAEAVEHYGKAMGWTRNLGLEFDVGRLPGEDGGLDSMWRYIATWAPAAANDLA